MMEPDLFEEEDMGERVRHELRLFFVALQFFTRLPVPRWVGYDPRWLSQAARYFPAVGLVVGLLLALVYILATLLWPQAVAVLLSMVAGLLLTGAFHEDGFADTCDGFGGGSTPERVLEIMKDSRIGAYGAIGIMLMLGLKATTLATLPPATVVAALVLAHPLSRLCAVSLIWRMAYVRDEGKSKPIAERMSSREFGIAAVTVVPALLLVLVSGWIPFDGIVVGVLLAAGAMFWMARMFRRRIGGYTGDCLGAVQQIAELAFYLGVLTAIAY
ncbi:adenosylcobinamide-GDP ribazoletransferase [Oxalicibacterium flavum]|uniref:Adenosylcobinamide-GDP ribazoletransferase n=2 Tax=Oxalicibacterium flavum TaxID=179467 RepID=A0A8J2XV90_9BURK|nr:adenosylcobinamide-GDP ribazoletransferase [Oxalicibacterium flavum]